MKRVILVAILAFLASYSWSGYPVASAGFAGNGDHNGDEALDLSDAVYLLAHLFQGGPAPLPCPGVGGGAAVTPGMAIGAGGGGAPDPELPATGQGFCKDSNGTETSCPTSECPGQDGDLQVGCPMEGRFVILPGPNGLIEDPEGPMVDDTVFDRCTGLQWQRGTADIGGDGAPDVPDGVLDEHDRRSWAEALTYCEGLDYGSHTDWRLPNLMELQSILNYNPVADKTLVDDAFTLGKFPVAANMLSFHWTSTCKPRPDLSPDRLRAVYVEFTSGGAGPSELTFFDTATQQDEDTRYLVRAVRRGTINTAAGGGAVARDQGQGGGVSGNGDVNGDLSIDLSDAIYLLSFLFQGGPMPEPCPEIVETDCVGGNCCGNNVDDDSDGSTDCDDADCDADAICLAAPEVCNNASDDDLDGDTDCADADCVLDPSCDIATPLPATGVTSCYDENGQATPCAGTGQDAEYQAGCVISPRFDLDLGPDEMMDGNNSPVDDTIIDNCTGLMWQRQNADTNGNGTINNNAPGPEGDADDPATPGLQGDSISWCDPEEPIDSLSYCEALDFAGHSDWRLPNIREAFSLMDYGRESGNLIDPVFGTNHVRSSTVTGSSTVLQVLYNRGGIDSTPVGPKLKIIGGTRCVRTAVAD